MLQLRGELDLATEPLGVDPRGQLRRQVMLRSPE